MTDEKEEKDTGRKGDDFEPREPPRPLREDLPSRRIDRGLPGDPDSERPRREGDRDL